MHQNDVDPLWYVSYPLENVESFLLNSSILKAERNPPAFVYVALFYGLSFVTLLAHVFSYVSFSNFHPASPLFLLAYLLILFGVFYSKEISNYEKNNKNLPALSPGGTSIHAFSEQEDHSSFQNPLHTTNFEELRPQLFLFSIAPTENNGQNSAMAP